MPLLSSKPPPPGPGSPPYRRLGIVWRSRSTRARRRVTSPRCPASSRMSSRRSSSLRRPRRRGRRSMNSPSAAPAGVQRPRVRVAPRVKRSDADDAEFLAASYGLTPDEWQRLVLEDWLAVRPDGRWASLKCGLAVPRQNGKNALLEIRELYGMVALGEKFLHTAHEVKTARKAFLRIASFFENPRKWPELAELVKEIRRTNGQEAVVLHNGGSVEFVARSKGSGRGFTVDVLVMDEAQELGDDALEALMPTTAASPLGNP